MAREFSERDLAYETLGAEDFESQLSTYDTERRVEILIDRFLGGRDLSGCKVLEVGCGLGYFSRELVKRGCELTVSDISPSLVEKVSSELGCKGVVADALNLTDSFEENQFEGVLSSECIEHTPEPLEAVRGMTRMIRPGGWISLSTPNLIWQPIVRFATKLKARRFCGYENFSTFGGLERELVKGGCTILESRGLHPWPFQFPLHVPARLVEERCQFAKGLMINICLLAEKESENGSDSAGL